MASPESPFPRFERRRDAPASGWAPVDLGGHEVVARLHMQLKPGPQAAAEGRHALDRLDGSIDDRKLDELRLLITELLTNSVRHGSQDNGWISLDVEIFANAVRAAVTDAGPGFEPAREPQPHGDRPGGWGLYLVDRLADRWGVDCGGKKTSVWFEVDRDQRFAVTA
jgi:anti-sigma regulatory factor (Ser/Thr protein kinase)